MGHPTQSLQDLPGFEDVTINWYLKLQAIVAYAMAILLTRLSAKSFTTLGDINAYLNVHRNKKIFIIIPAISTGKPELGEEFIDYLDTAASIRKKLKQPEFSVNLFLLGANHKGDGFLHLKAKNYLTNTHKIPLEEFVGNDKTFYSLGLCTAEEMQLLSEFLTTDSRWLKYQFVTIVSKSQFTRYFLIQRGYGIKSLYYILPDKPSYYHVEIAQLEKVLIALSFKDPKWQGFYGQKMRHLAHFLRSPSGS